MMSKKVYLLVTAALILLSIGTGFAMQQRQQPGRAAMHALEMANFQLGRDTQMASVHRAKVMSLVQQAIQEMESDQNKP